MNEDLGYDKTSIASIFEYSKKLIGHSLNGVVDPALKSMNLQGQGKGGLGQMIEKYFFRYNPNSDPGPDFKEAGLELKATGLKKLHDGEYQIKERLVCDMIDYSEVVKEDFETSLFYLKCRIMLLIFYLYQKNVSKWNLRYIYTVIWKLPEKDLLIIKHDFEVIVDKIKHGEAHLLSEGDTEYLGACRKGQKDSKLRHQPYSNILAPGRAFSLKTAYMRTVLDFIKSQGQSAVSNVDLKKTSKGIVTSTELKAKSFEQIILDRFQPWIGKTVGEIIEHYSPGLNLKAKDIDYVSACLIASDGKLNGRGKQHIENAEEFKKSGLRFKTIPTYASGKVKESMSYENIDYQEIYDNDQWFDSTTYELFSSRFIFLVFRHPTINSGGFDYDYESLILDKVFFWTMPPKDLDVAEQYWTNIRTHVLKNEISLKYFWKLGDKKLFHVRPKGTANSYKNAAINPNGGKADKYCYWFNGEYVQNIINQKTL